MKATKSQEEATSPRKGRGRKGKKSLKARTTVSKKSIAVNRCEAFSG